jgi:hypothetical protein
MGYGRMWRLPAFKARCNSGESAPAAPVPSVPLARARGWPGCLRRVCRYDNLVMDQQGTSILGVADFPVDPATAPGGGAQMGNCALLTGWVWSGRVGSGRARSGPAVRCAGYNAVGPLRPH